MQLDITPALVHDLLESPRAALRPESTGIVLGPDGWTVAVWPEQAPDPGLIAFTAEDAHAWADEDGELDDDTVTALCTPADPDDGADYRILGENGRRTPGAGTRWQVITATTDHADEDTPGSASWSVARHWRDAVWFDQDGARELVQADPAEARTDSRDRTDALWLTSGGRYLLYRRSASVTEMPEEWEECTLKQAVLYTYRAAGHRVTAELPPALAAARHARALADELTAPRVRLEGDPELARGAARRVLDEAAETVHATKAVSELLRSQVLADLRQQRAATARVVEQAHDDRQAAADHLGMSYPTLSNLINYG
ncbi:hypothetical protein I5Q34_07400 [Streptomyces sp. AV19]|uniref:hypothetical protein n=1 Tax=Streptomyces sp. AV19 TaxID=2793068 RepID=UPI0018FE9E18|nr:hypothetical protein [Streptomyces sp. AV19]MBH1934121.1 hypothetical protein [Streptomyces sp. AV19]MDG4537157.1 hypothetical protein [Streptomyces sp. AV19]